MASNVHGQPQYYMWKASMSSQPRLSIEYCVGLMNDIYRRIHQMNQLFEWRVLPTLTHGYNFAFAIVPKDNPPKLPTELGFTWDNHMEQVHQLGGGDSMVVKTTTGGRYSALPSHIFTRTRYFYVGTKPTQTGLTINIVHYAARLDPHYIPGVTSFQSAGSRDQATQQRAQLLQWQQEDQARRERERRERERLQAEAEERRRTLEGRPMLAKLQEVVEALPEGSEERRARERSLEALCAQMAAASGRQYRREQWVEAAARLGRECELAELNRGIRRAEDMLQQEPCAEEAIPEPRQPAPFSEPCPFAVSCPAAPAKPMTPYTVFSKEVWGDVKAGQPDLKLGDVAGLIGERWRALKPHVRAGYDRAYEQAKEQYQLDLQAYHESDEYAQYRSYTERLREWEARKAAAAREHAEYRRLKLLRAQMIAARLSGRSDRSARAGLEVPYDSRAVEFLDEPEAPYSVKHLAMKRYHSNRRLAAELFAGAVEGAATTAAAAAAATKKAGDSSVSAAAAATYAAHSGDADRAAACTALEKMLETVEADCAHLHGEMLGAQQSRKRNAGAAAFQARLDQLRIASPAELTALLPADRSSGAAEEVLSGSGGGGGGGGGVVLSKRVCRREEAPSMRQNGQIVDLSLKNAGPRPSFLLEL